MTANRRAREAQSGIGWFMANVYGYMVGGLVLSGLVAFLLPYSSVLMDALYVVDANHQIVGFEPFAWFLMVLPIGISVFLGYSLPTMKLHAVELAFWLFALLMGASLSVVFVLYSGQSVAGVFFIAAATFAAMSFMGYVTRRSLSGLGTFLFMVLFGLIITSIINLFLQSGTVQFFLSVIAVFLFAGITAYDTQRIKNIYATFGGDSEWGAKLALMGALSLYLDFINLFINMVTLFARRKG